MKRVCPVLLAFLGMILLLPIRPVWAVTYAYIPGFDGVVRVNTNNPTDAVTFTFTDPACRPFGAAVAPDGSFVIVTCAGEGQNRIFFLDDSHFSAEPDAPTPVNVGVRPRGVAVAPGGDFAYVTNSGSDTVAGDESVSVINTATRAVTATIPIGDSSSGVFGDGPLGVAAVASGDQVKVYVANNLRRSVSVITDDGTPEVTIAGLAVGNEPIGVAATPDGRHVFVANNGSDSVSVIRTSTDEVVFTLINAGPGPWGVAVGSRGDFLFVTNSDDDISGRFNRVTVFPINNDAVVTFSSPRQVTVGTQPLGVAAPINGDFAYVINQGPEADPVSTISEIDITADPPVATTVDLGPAGIQAAFALGAFIGGAPPVAPSALSGTAGSFDRIDLTWTDNSDDELGFIIERRVQGSADFIQIVETPPNATSYTDVSVTSETTYEYRIRTLNETSFSAYATSSAVTTPEGEFHWCFIGTITAGVFGIR